MIKLVALSAFFLAAFNAFAAPPLLQAGDRYVGKYLRMDMPHQGLANASACGVQVVGVTYEFSGGQGPYFFYTAIFTTPDSTEKVQSIGSLLSLADGSLQLNPKLEFMNSIELIFDTVSGTPMRYSRSTGFYGYSCESLSKVSNR